MAHELMRCPEIFVAAKPQYTRSAHARARTREVRLVPRPSSDQVSLHEDPMGLVFIWDLAFRVWPDVLEPAGAVQAVGCGHEVRAVEADPLVARELGFGDELGEHSAAQPATAMQGVDVHALDLSGLGADSLHAGDPDCVIARDRQQKPTVRSLKLGESAQVALDKPTDRQPEAVSVFKPVVAPGEVSKPQALNGVQVWELSKTLIAIWRPFAGVGVVPGTQLLITLSGDVGFIGGVTGLEAATDLCLLLVSEVLHAVAK